MPLFIACEASKDYFLTFLPVSFLFLEIKIYKIYKTAFTFIRIGLYDMHKLMNRNKIKIVIPFFVARMQYSAGL